MLSSLLYALSLIFIIIGLFYLFSFFLCFLLCGKRKNGIYTVIYHDGTDEELYDKVYTAFLQSDFFTPFVKRPIIILDNGIPEGVKNQCKFIVEPWSEIHFVKYDEIESISHFDTTAEN